MSFSLLFIALALSLVSLSQADCGPQNYANDPLPWGGANCTKDLDCGGAIGSGICDFTKGAGNCVCAESRAMPLICQEA